MDLRQTRAPTIDELDKWISDVLAGRISTETDDGDYDLEDGKYFSDFFFLTIFRTPTDFFSKKTKTAMTMMRTMMRTKMMTTQMMKTMKMMTTTRTTTRMMTMMMTMMTNKLMMVEK